LPADVHKEVREPVPFSIDNNQGRQLLRLEGAVTIREAHEFAAKLCEGLEEGAPVDVDTGDLEDIDTPILQLLCSLRKTVPELCIDKPSEAFVTAVDRCGLRRELLSTREAV
jgi:anti-anti-sigma regulatory factor